MSKLTSRIGVRRACRYAAAGRGFTLVELLVVVAIIALLVSILLPSLSKAKEQTRIVVCMVNLKGMSTAFNCYTTENDDWYPAGSPYGGTQEYIWDSILQPYFQVHGLLHCPSDRAPRDYERYVPEEYGWYPRSYGINTQVTGMGPSKWGNENGYNYDVFPWPGWVHKTSEILVPTDTILLGEMWESWYYGPAPLTNMYHDFRGYGISPWASGLEATADVHRNDDAANYLFCDGRVALLPADDRNLNGGEDDNNFYYWWRGKWWW